MDKELQAFVPGLFMAWAEPGQSEPTYLGKHIVPKTFDTIFMFKERDGKEWTAIFTVSVSDLGTPSLDSVVIRQGVDRWKIKLIEQYRYTLLELALKIVVKTRTPSFRDANEKIHNDKYYEKLLKDGKVELNADNWGEYLNQEPHTEPVELIRWWDGTTDPLTRSELSDLTRLLTPL